ncbi:MAG: bifunctional (p)ppGpp synthetase/guanosine-3',5'-bis(diphosphate) 3'-pyrophosphohydrolase [SAR324 cluster bacterium]|nr:bifunctional (p)ppGpp synthetase/guanosine-3',5'-bis(diphosphate) 3'-pyrophosphohydrolase [SAR324 cluster bacterium]
MLEQFKTTLQSVDSISQNSINWLWKIVTADSFQGVDIERSISILQKIQQLKLNADYIEAFLLFLLFPEQKNLPIQNEIIPPLPLAHYHALQRIFALSPSLRNEQQAELFLKMIIRSTKDLQLLSLILAIRLDELEGSANFPAEKQKSVAQKSLSVYAPLAERLGIFWIKSELEDAALRYVTPEMYYELKQKVAKKRNERLEMVDRITSEIGELMGRLGISHKVQGRYKRFYSIYKKLKKVNYDFDRIQDLTAFRILVDNVHDCYQALGYIHEHWTPKTGRFKDYISKPKPNGYRSLHTTVLDEKGESVEIQIRTHEMHEIAEFGIAAHWQYKREQKLGKKNTELYNTLRKKAQSAKQNIPDFEAPSMDWLTNKIYVFTPQNDVVELPAGATAVDFAYAIHTHVGHYVIAAKANGKIIKLDDALSNEDHLEVITSPKQNPHQEWLKFVKTSKAKNKIRHAVREREREANKKSGEMLLDKLFKRHSLNLNRMMKDGRLERMAQKQKNQFLEHILCSIGEGTLKPDEVLTWFIDPAEIEIPTPTDAPVKRKRKKTSNFSNQLVMVDGMSDMLVHFAKCCSPKQGDNIHGYLTQGRGVSVHRTDCPSFQRLDKTRRIFICWSEPNIEPVCA